MTRNSLPLSTVAHPGRQPLERALLRCVLLCAPLSVGAAHAAVITVGQPGDTACNFLILQSAINAAAAAPGLDIIRLSAGSYGAQRLRVSDTGDLAIEGGFVNCATPVLAGVSTLNGAGANPTGSVLEHDGNGRLTLSDLHITNGLSDYGGGVFSFGPAAVTLKRVLLFNNRATAGGGGLYAENFIGMPTKELNLLGVGFNSNTALSGGGLWVANTNVVISSDDVNYFAGNVAQGTQHFHGGGAIYAQNSTVLVHSLPPAQSPFMDGNSAQRNGGAIAFVANRPGVHSLQLLNRVGDRPLQIANNAASGKGGAIFMLSGNAGGSVSAQAALYNTIILDNDAPEGAAFYLDATDASHQARTSLLMEQSSAGSSIPPCPQHLRCNSIELSRGSSTVAVYSNGGMGRSTFDLRRGRLIDNINLNGTLMTGVGNLWLDNSVVANNTAGNDYLISTISHELRITNSTFAGNTFGAPAVFAVLLSPASLTLHNSIVFQPGKQVHVIGSGVTTNLRNLLVGNGHGLVDLAARNIQFTADPLFVNPGADDFRLQLGSQARDRWAAGGGVLLPSVDLLGAGRPVASPGSPTPYDFGAYEYGAVIDWVFRDGFDSN